MREQRIEFGRFRVLIVPVNTRQYGHLALEIATGFARAMASQSSVYWEFQGGAVSSGLAALACPRVRIVDSWAAWGVWLLERVHQFVRRTGEWCREVVIELRLLARVECKKRKYPPGLTRWLREFSDGDVEMPWRDKVSKGPYMRRKILRHPVPIAQRVSVADAARARARALGIADDQPIVTLHVREAGFKLGREMHNAKANARDDSSRNGRIELMRSALDLLGSRGFKVVRTGDNSMTPYAHPALIDLTQVTPYDSHLEVFCLLRSRFLIAGEAGPSGASYLTNTPLLTVNATDPISSFPIRRHGLMVLKRVRDRQTGRMLRLDELLTEDYANNLRNTTRYQYIDNTPEELLASVEEMLDDLDHDRPELPAQAAFREDVMRACDELAPRHAYVRKWGLDEGFLGDGRLARFTFDSWAWERTLTPR